MSGCITATDWTKVESNHHLYKALSNVILHHTLGISMWTWPVFNNKTCFRFSSKIMVMILLLPGRITISSPSSSWCVLIEPHYKKKKYHSCLSSFFLTSSISANIDNLAAVWFIFLFKTNKIIFELLSESFWKMCLLMRIKTPKANLFPW